MNGGRLVRWDGRRQDLLPSGFVGSINGVISTYTGIALRNAHYEMIENGRFHGSIPMLPGVWSEGDTLEQCREELLEVLEEWIALAYKRGDTIPVLEGCDINLVSEHA